MQKQLRQSVQVLVEENNIARCIHDISVKIENTIISSRTICSVKLTDIIGDMYVGKLD